MNDHKLPDIALYIDKARLIKKPELQRLLNVSRSTLGRWIKSGEFPPPAKVINGRSLWHFQDVNRWMMERASRAG
ncbi:helix-turn-helix transcriptional regulator [Pseudoalteromonas ruthenica]|uniref:Helix-turn-helix domain-containing protein n=1 Tax=Pseudoalteromonas ruthenica TaxID=151081 RepID=A0A0F4PEU4_9GAMM|nr:helix-turn-helix domain-containing protein [Pseudoalteromonas ruthenica]KJY93930.1 hypothetical protein TW76_18585 [Pseudoalteromonas ruthenica]KJY96420.1 hypothetical protein TW72_16915 [Pseudoalteromonas ruthenica]TMO94592.1 helix-turn-helix domain-containing protein [Pseudoalteromonas ruthenica]TMO97249.1 helix-turn-helix domain-containing protein [Pseudoalteromonas ruthenica]TMP09203.1 helix-turn-helix domain-containing protein [Pseudoalteromonas ruthenica]